MKSKRMDEIEKLALEQENLSLEELQEHFSVSINTIRRDINELLKRGTIEKVYGGIRAKKSSTVAFESRNVVNQAAKKKICETAAKEIQENDIIFLDSGTTTSQIIPFLNPFTKCTILTNNFDILNACTNFPNVSLYVIGSNYKASTRSFITPISDTQLNSFNIGKAFMAATGVSFKQGLSNSDIFENLIKKEICQRSHEIFLLADESKYNHSTLLTYAELPLIDHVISDKIPQNYKQYFQNHNIRFTECQ